jgi:hypothetical protein
VGPIYDRPDPTEEVMKGCVAGAPPGDYQPTSIKIVLEAVSKPPGTAPLSDAVLTLRLANQAYIAKDDLPAGCSIDSSGWLRD